MTPAPPYWRAVGWPNDASPKCSRHGAETSIVAADISDDGKAALIRPPERVSLNRSGILVKSGVATRGDNAKRPCDTH